MTLRGDSRPLLRFSIFALLTLVVALTVTGCAGATSAAKPGSDAKSSIVSITTEALATGTTNVMYSASFAAQGGVQPYRWSITSGKLPAGIALAPSTGAITGIPTAAGTASLTVKVTDSSASAQSSSESFTLTIDEPETPLAISTTSLPAGGMRANYNATMQATGGTTPYAWSVSSGALPSGLTLGANGAISGSPAKAGSFSFVAEVTDSASPKNRATKSFSVEVSTARYLARNHHLLARGGKKRYRVLGSPRRNRRKDPIHVEPGSGQTTYWFDLGEQRHDFRDTHQAWNFLL